MKDKTIYKLKIRHVTLHMDLCPNIVIHAYILCVRVQSSVGASINPQLSLHNKSMILGK